jgi:uncharacterized BrkB/YihY/UPF0761 family membrane protein
MSDANLREISSDKLLSFFALSALLIGLVGGLILIGVAGTIENTSDFQAFGTNGFNLIYLSIGIVSLISGFFFFAILKGFADIVYLLKKMASK